MLGILVFGAIDLGRAFLTWNQVKTGLDPKAYTLRTAPALLKKTKAWADYCDGEQPLAPAIRKLKVR